MINQFKNGDWKEKVAIRKNAIIGIRSVKKIALLYYL